MAGSTPHLVLTRRKIPTIPTSLEGRTLASCRGTGFGFLLTAIDDDETDRFRIKIWNVALDEVVYDNKAGSTDTSEDATALRGGNIVIQKKGS